MIIRCYLQLLKVFCQDLFSDCLLPLNCIPESGENTQLNSFVTRAFKWRKYQLPMPLKAIDLLDSEILKFIMGD